MPAPEAEPAPLKIWLTRKKELDPETALALLYIKGLYFKLRVKGSRVIHLAPTEFAANRLGSI